MKFEKQRVVELDTIDEDLELRNCDVLTPSQGDTITIRGTLKVRGPLTVQGSLHVSSIEAKDRIVVEGDLVADGENSRAFYPMGQTDSWKVGQS